LKIAGMRRRTLALLFLLSTGVACGRGTTEESGGVSQTVRSTLTGDRDEGGHEPPFVPPPPAPTGGFGPMQVTPEKERATVSSPSTTGGSGGATDACGSAPALTEYTLAKGGGHPTSVAAAADRSVWFSDPATTSIGRLDPTGAVSRYALPPGRAPGQLAVGPDGSVWFATTGPAIGHLTSSGRLIGYALPTKEANPLGAGGDSAPGPMTAGPDGAMWFVETGADKVGRITPDGTITEYPLPGRDRRHANPEGIAAGSDGAVWVSEVLTMRMARIDVHTFTITEFPIPPVPAGVPPATVTAGPDGALWFDGPMGSAIGRMTTTGDFKAFPLPWQGQYSPSSATAGPDGRIWFLDSRNGKVLRMTLQGAVSELPPVADPKSLSAGGLQQMTAGPDAVWFAEPDLNRVGRFSCRPDGSDEA
jgi:virginiamycin B lyase